MRTHLLRPTVVMLAIALPVGCGRTPPPPPAAEKPKSEQDLARTTLPAKAVQSLRIRAEKLQTQPVQEQAQLTGWVMARQGHEVTLAAEVAGYVREPADPRMAPLPGVAVQKGQELLRLEPVLSPLEQIKIAADRRTAESEVNKAKESHTVADKEYQRVLGLYNQKLRAEQDLEQAQARLKHAKEDLAAAEHRLALYTGAANGKPDEKNAPLQLTLKLVTAPRAGTVLAVHVSPGQYVSLAAPLVTVADLSQLWVRVPVPEHDLPRVDCKQPACLVLRAAAERGKPQVLALRPVAVVPLVDVARHTADLIYELPAAASERGIMAKDQMVSVNVPLLDPAGEKVHVVPYAAVVFDAYSGAWVYFDVTKGEAGERVYERRRVELGPNVELPAGVYEGTLDGIVVRCADPPGNWIVTDGAAAIYSREFHRPPVATALPKSQVDDDD